MPKGDHNAELNRARAALLRSRHEKNYTVDTATSCWHWNGPVGTDGYGKLKRFRKTVRAHRFFYECFVGPIPNGLFVCHTCDNARCVNPSHLWLGTHAENEADKDRKGRRSASPSLTHPESLRRGELHPNAKLTATAVASIRNTRGGAKKLARVYGVGLSTIYRIRNGTAWKHTKAGRNREAPEPTTTTGRSAR